MDENLTTGCPRCSGLGIVDADTCPNCRGLGEITHKVAMKLLREIKGQDELDERRGK